MKRLFISVPMRNRTEHAIKASMEQMHKIAEAVFGEELEVIPTYFEDDPPENTNMALWYLGESIKKLSEADRFIGIYDEDKGYRGCIIENLAAKNYGIPSYLVNAISKMKLVLDSGKTVGELAPKIDSNMGGRNILAERGVI